MSIQDQNPHKRSFIQYSRGNPNKDNNQEPFNNQNQERYRNRSNSYGRSRSNFRNNSIKL